LLELPVQLRRERFVVAHYQRRPAMIRDYRRHRHRLARPRHAEQRLELLVVLKARAELADRLRLVTRRGERKSEFELRHQRSPRGMRVACSGMPLRFAVRHVSNGLSTTEDVEGSERGSTTLRA